jgi:hypothetical protein
LNGSRAEPAIEPVTRLGLVQLPKNLLNERNFFRSMLLNSQPISLVFLKYMFWYMYLQGTNPYVIFTIFGHTSSIYGDFGYQKSDSDQMGSVVSRKQDVFVWLHGTF